MIWKKQFFMHESSVEKNEFCGKPQKSKENKQNNKFFFPKVRNWNRVARNVA